MDDIELRAEDVESRAWADLLSATDGLQDLHANAERIGPATRLASRDEPSILFNRTIGLDREPATDDHLEGVLRRYADERITGYLIHVHDHGPGQRLQSMLERRGLTRFHRGWVKVIRGREPPATVETPFRVAPCPPEHAEAYGRILALGFDLSEAGARMFAASVGRPKWYTFLAFNGTRPVAAGGLFVDSDMGYLSGAATVPSARGRGAQGALMQARIHLGVDLGCRHLVTETGEEVPGEPQHSYKNMMRHRFAPLHVRHSWIFCPS